MALGDTLRPNVEVSIVWIVIGHVNDPPFRPCPCILSNLDTTPNSFPLFQLSTGTSLFQESVADIPCYPEKSNLDIVSQQREAFQPLRRTRSSSVI